LRRSSAPATAARGRRGRRGGSSGTTVSAASVIAVRRAPHWYRSSVARSADVHGRRLNHDRRRHHRLPVARPSSLRTPAVTALILGVDAVRVSMRYRGGAPGPATTEEER
jgi:hypothetical protein